MIKPLIEVSDLSLSIGGKQILHSLSLDIYKGQYVSIIGPNGSGKTSFIKCLAGIYEKWKGHILVDGKALRQYDRKASAGLISYVPQIDDRDIPFTVETFIAMARYPHLSPFSQMTQEDRKHIELAMDYTETTSFRDRNMAGLSGGERQMVFIAAALAQSAAILVMDEPTTFLDYRHQWDVMRILERIKYESGMTIIAVHHDVNHAFAHSDYLFALKDGTVLLRGDGDEFMREEILADIYQIPFSILEDKNRKITTVTAVHA